MKICVTVDDMPQHGPTVNPYSYSDLVSIISNILSNLEVPGVIGFINGIFLKKSADNFRVLKEWMEKGYYLGNHTYSHFDLRTITAEEYIEDIRKNHDILVNKFRVFEKLYFRFPFLLEGETVEKFYKIRNYLRSNNYRVVPVTVDYLDYLWNEPVCACLLKNDHFALEKLRELYIEAAIYRFEASRKIAWQFYSRDINYILLIHSGIATALFLGDVISAYRKLGCDFVELDEIFKDKIYEVDPIFISHKSPNYLLRLAKVRGEKVEWPSVDIAQLNRIAGIKLNTPQ